MQNFNPLPPKYGPYEVSDTGIVRNIRTGATINPVLNRCGYTQNMLHVSPNRPKNCYTHRLVALAHIPGDSSLTVNHKNGIKTDNRVDNLEWATMSHQQKHRHQLHPHLGPLSSAQKSKPIIAISPDGTRTNYPSATALQRLTNGHMKQSAIQLAITKGLTRYGLRFEYLAKESLAV